MKKYFLAHVADTSHEENEDQDTAAVEPMYLVVIAVGVALIGFLVWKFLMKK